STFQLHGVNRSGTEYACVQGFGPFDGPSDDASVAAIASWHGVNAVRVPLNEDCWLGINGFPNGGYSAAQYQAAIAAYVQQLVTPIRGAGASNVIMAGGLSFANVLSVWLQYRPTDPANQLAASFHTYNFNTCHDVACWDSQVAPVAAQVPVVTGEIGEDDG